MKYVFICLICLFSTNSLAKIESIYLSSGLQKSSLTLNGAEIDLEDSLFIKAGYPFILAPNYFLILEFEYNKIGSFERNVSDGLNYERTNVDASSYGINLKYLSYLFDSDFYLASLLSANKYSLDLMIDSLSQETTNGTILQTTIKGAKEFDEFGLSYGVEIGYSLPYSMNIAASYTMGRMVADGIAVDFISSQLILSYLF